MMDDDRDTLRKVAWSEIFPWLRIARAFRIAISFRVLVLAAVAALLTSAGWALFFWAFSGDPGQTEWLGPDTACPWVALTNLVADTPPALNMLVEQPSAEALQTSTRPGNPFFWAWARLSQPLWQTLIGEGLNISGLACLVLCGLWSLAIWAFFGGAIARIAAVQLTCDERVGLAPALRHACSKWFSYLGAPLFPVIGVIVAAIPIWLLGWLLRADAGVLLVALVWPLLLIGGLIMAVLLLGLIFGWPLMWGTISTEGTDAFDALSRSYAYVFQRPLHYLFYAVVAAVIGALGWLLVSNFASGIVGATYGAASWASGAERVVLIKTGAPPPLALEPVGRFGAGLIRFWAECVKLLAVGFIFAYFWSAATAIYLLLRRDVDATELDEVFLDEDASEKAYGLPPLKTDEAGAPVAADDVPEIEPDDTDQLQPEPQPET